MTSRGAVLGWVGAASLALFVSGATAATVQLTPVGRLAFPERAYVVDVSGKISAASAVVEVRENGRRIRPVLITPVAASGLKYGSILAIDASNSMKGRPYAAALRALSAFADRRAAQQEIGIIAFNSGLHVLRRPTQNGTALRSALRHPPRLGLGTRMYDAVDKSLRFLEQARVAAGSIVLLSDGADTGSRTSADEVVARALRDKIQIFTVGLRSATFETAPLRALASRTHGSYARAQSSADLLRIYAGLSNRLASEFVVRYQSQAVRGQHVQVAVTVRGTGAVGSTYVAGDSSSATPFHRSLIARFFLSEVSLVMFSFIAAALAAMAVVVLLRRPARGLVDRVRQFSPAPASASGEAADDHEGRPARRRYAVSQNDKLTGLRGKLARDFEIGRVPFAPQRFLLTIVGATVLAFVVLASLSLPFSIFALLVPVFALYWAAAKVRRVRLAFAEQLPGMLQLLASALRSGHSFTGALNVVVEKAPQPIRDEFAQVLTDDQIGLEVETSLRRVARRMASKDMEQVALLGELQRSAGGNSAEVLDTVVETVRERADVRRLARTLTAQGRLARWILTFMPPVITLFLVFTERPLMRPLFFTGIGQLALAGSGLMLVLGSLWIKNIVEIKV